MLFAHVRLDVREVTVTALTDAIRGSALNYVELALRLSLQRASLVDFRVEAGGTVAHNF